MSRFRLLLTVLLVLATWVSSWGGADACRRRSCYYPSDCCSPCYQSCHCPWNGHTTFFPHPINAPGPHSIQVPLGNKIEIRVANVKPEEVCSMESMWIKNHGCCSIICADYIRPWLDTNGHKMGLAVSFYTCCKGTCDIIIRYSVWNGRTWFCRDCYYKVTVI